MTLISLNSLLVIMNQGWQFTDSHKCDSVSMSQPQMHTRYCIEGYFGKVAIIPKANASLGAIVNDYTAALSNNQYFRQL